MTRPLGSDGKAITPLVVVGSRNITPADEQEEAFSPQPADVIDAVHEHILPLKGYKIRRECSTADLFAAVAKGCRLMSVD